MTSLRTVWGRHHRKEGTLLGSWKVHRIRTHKWEGVAVRGPAGTVTGVDLPVQREEQEV